MWMRYRTDNKDKQRLLFSIIISVSFLYFCSQSSPLYPLNDWVDTNVYLDMGSGILSGKVPYRDLLDHKGPLFHFLHALICLIPTREYWPVFIIECISFALYLYYCSKIIDLFYKAKIRYQFCSLITISYMFFSTGVILHGDSVEELTLPLLCLGLYTVLKSQKDNRLLEKTESFTLGVLVAAIFWMKYSVLGLFFGLAIYETLWCLLYKKEFTKTLIVILYFLTGFCVISVPILLFFKHNTAIYDLYHVYFYGNLHAYSTDTGILENSRNWTRVFLTHAGVLCFSFIGIIWTIRNNLNQENEWSRFIMAVGAITTVVFSCITPNFWNYYVIPLYSVAIVGFVPFVKLEESLTVRIKKNSNKEFQVLLIVLVAVLLIYVVGSISSNFHFLSRITTFVSNSLGFLVFLFAVQTLSIYTDFKQFKFDGKIILPIALCVAIAACVFNSRFNYLLRYKKADLPQFQFEKIISESNNPKLLLFDCPDYGFFRTAGLTPQFFNYCIMNVFKEESRENQATYIMNNDPDYIISIKPLDKYRPLDASGYILLMEYDSYPYEAGSVNLYLYGRNSE